MAKREIREGRRQFLKRAAVAGGAAGAAAAGGAAMADAGPNNVPQAQAEPETKGYHLTPHIAQYYRLARF